MGESNYNEICISKSWTILWYTSSHSTKVRCWLSKTGNFRLFLAQKIQLSCTCKQSMWDWQLHIWAAETLVLKKKTWPGVPSWLMQARRIKWPQQTGNKVLLLGLTELQFQIKLIVQSMMDLYRLHNSSVWLRTTHQSRYLLPLNRGLGGEKHPTFPDLYHEVVAWKGGLLHS